MHRAWCKACAVAVTSYGLTSRAPSARSAAAPASRDSTTTQIVVDLEARSIQAGALTAPFQIDDYTRWRLLEGLDDIGLTLRHEADITTFEHTRPAWKPTTEPVDTPNGRVAAESTFASS